MQKLFATLILGGCLILTACGGNADYDDALTTSGTACHEKYHKRAYNKPYEIKGKTYRPQKHYEYSATGKASFYGGGDGFHGCKTSNGEVFDMHSLSAAHKTLPIPSVVLVTNLNNGRTLKLKINDRGPFKDGRIIDVSRKAARMLGFEQKGLADVRVETLVPESLVLANNMANGSRQSLPRQNSPVMLAQASGGNQAIRSRAKTRAMHLAVQDIIIPTQANPKALNAEYDHQQLHLHPSVYSNQRLPNISLVPRTQSARKVSRSNNVGVARASTRQNNIDSENFFVQTGAFNRFTVAQKLISMVTKSSPKIKAKMQPVKMNNQQMFRVMVGPFAKKSQANSYVNKLKNLDKRSSIVIN